MRDVLELIVDRLDSILAELRRANGAPPSDVTAVQTGPRIEVAGFGRTWVSFVVADAPKDAMVGWQLIKPITTIPHFQSEFTISTAGLDEVVVRAIVATRTSRETIEYTHFVRSPTAA